MVRANCLLLAGTLAGVAACGEQASSLELRSIRVASPGCGVWNNHYLVAYRAGTGADVDVVLGAIGAGRALSSRDGPVRVRSGNLALDVVRPVGGDGAVRVTAVELAALTTPQPLFLEVAGYEFGVELALAPREADDHPGGALLCADVDDLDAATPPPAYTPGGSIPLAAALLDPSPDARLTFAIVRRTWFLSELRSSSLVAELGPLAPDAAGRVAGTLVAPTPLPPAPPMSEDFVVQVHRHDADGELLPAEAVFALDLSGG